MREIKFRGVRNFDGIWVFGNLLMRQCESPVPETSELYTSSYIVPIDGLDCHENDVDPSTIGQYTGLRDKNGVEIYEGDILQELSRGEYAEATGIPLSELEDLPADAGRMVSVVYNAPSFEFAPNEYGYIFLNNPHLFRVIGNVHENHELMKGGSREA